MLHANTRMTDGVAFLNLGTAHGDNLVVSLLSLTEHWDGPIVIWAGDGDGARTAHLCADDGRLGNIKVVEFDFQAMKQPGISRGNHYLAKTYVMRHLSPFDRTVFVDADTIFAGDFSDVFPQKGTEEIRITQFCDWPSTGRMMRGRIEKWRNEANVEVVRMLSAPYPAINTGVVGFTSLSTRFMASWEEMTRRRVEFIADEIACQLIYPDFPHCVMDMRWNASPRHCWSFHGISGTLADGRKIDGPEDHDRKADPRIWHNHGKKAVKEARSRYLWMPYYDRAIKLNLAKIKNWSPCRGNDRLQKYLKDRTCWGPDFIPHEQREAFTPARG